MKKNATEKDPWGLEYTKTNIAGGGAYKVARWQAGSEVVYERNDSAIGFDLSPGFVMQVQFLELCIP